jgi:hypothetical protein
MSRQADKATASGVIENPEGLQQPVFADRLNQVTDFLRPVNLRVVGVVNDVPDAQRLQRPFHPAFSSVQKKTARHR